MIDPQMGKKRGRKCVLILNWNSYEDTICAIELLGGCNWPIVIVDNASHGIDVRMIRDRFPHIPVIENDKNLGYAGGMNVGMKWALAEGFTHALLLNPDTLPTLNVIEAMDSLSTDAAIVGTAQVTSDLKSYVSAAMLDGRKPRSFRCESGCGSGHDVDIVSGAALLIHLEAAQAVNYMDERFFHYKEEFDFCYRITATGRKIVYSCSPALVHKQGGSLSTTSNAAVYYWYRNEILFLQKHFGPFGWLSGLGIFRNAFQTIWSSRSTWPSAMKGVLHGLEGVTGPIRTTPLNIRSW